MKRLYHFALTFGATFVLFTIIIQMVVGYATSQNFVEIPWDGSMILAGLFAFIGAGQDAISTE